MMKSSIQPYAPEIRFRDIDAMGHVNNAVFLSYFEQARIHFFRQLVGKFLFLSEMLGNRLEMLQKSNQ